jgi:NAD(P)-dependent dehydrogenase (short-subunit alcohol dehydrogenase family)
MDSSSKLIWLVTGANSGLGLCIVQQALAKGHTVIATARNLSKFPQSLHEDPNAHLIELEVTGSAQVITKVVDDLVARFDHIDVLVNNAGYGLMGAVEELTEQEVRYQFDVNFFGPLNLTKAMLPHMRQRRSGIILQMSSCSGVFCLEGSPIYTASKQALEGMSEGLALEVKRLDCGVRIHLVEPGYFRTSFIVSALENRKDGEWMTELGYKDMKGAIAGLDGSQPGDPTKAAERVFEFVTGTGMGKGMEDELRLVLGSDCLGMLNTRIEQYSHTAKAMKTIAPSTDY